MAIGPDMAEQALTKAETLFDLLAMRSKFSSPCLIEDGVGIGWPELFDRSRAVAAGFSDLGVREGDRVAIWLPNRSAWLVALFACAQLGAIAVSINTRFRSAEVGDLLSRSASKVLVYWPGYKDIDFAGILAQCASEALSNLERIVLYTEDDLVLPASIIGKPVISYNALLSKPPLQDNRGRPESGCVIFTTSGTTRAPKLVMHSQRNVLSHAFNVARHYGMTSKHRFLLLPPFCGVFGFCGAMTALAAGTPLILAPTWNAALFADLIETHAVSHMVGSDDALAQLFEVRGAGLVFPSITFAGMANLNPAHADIVVRGEAKGVELCGLYGSSEMQALFSLGDRDKPAAIRGRAGGRPASGSVKVRCRDPETQALCKPGEIGELEFLAPESRFIGYFSDEAATRAAFTDDGYFKSGDLGSAEADGTFVYLARMGDTLRLGGFLVSPAEIEELIQEHPDVASCQIVGARTHDAIKPIAFVIPRSGAVVTEADVISHAAARLAKYKVPVKVYTVDEFPTTPSANGSKIQKNKLRDMAESRLAMGVESDDGRVKPGCDFKPSS